MLNCRMGCFSYSLYVCFFYGVNDCYRNFEAQKKQNACQQRGFLRSRPFTHKATKTWAATFCPASLALGPALLQKLLCPAAHKATIVFSAFGRSFFADGGR
jgi:hypothetical protein